MNLFKTFLVWFFVVAGLIIIPLVIVAAIAFLIAFPVMWLWNLLMPTIFCVTKITIFQAIGLNLLAGLLIRPKPWANKVQNIKFDQYLKKMLIKGAIKDWIKKNNQERK